MPRPLFLFAGSTMALPLLGTAWFCVASNSALASSWDWTTPDWGSTPPGDALTKGVWDDLEELSDFHDGNNGTPANPDTNWHNERNPVHGALLRNPSGTKGLVLMFRHFAWYVFNLDTGTETVFDIGTWPENGEENGMWPFCAGHAFNPDGTLLITGGDHSWYDDPDGYPKKTTTAWEYPAEPWAAKFDPAGGPNNYYVPLPDMDDGVNPPHARWYPTNITMPDGSVWVVAGDYWVDTNNDGEMNEAPLEEYPWIRWNGSAWSSVHSDPLGADVATRPLYPYFHVMPSGCSTRARTTPITRRSRPAAPIARPGSGHGTTSCPSRRARRVGTIVSSITITARASC